MAENCGVCGGFLSEQMDCNKCGAFHCEICGDMLDCDYCIECEPKEYLEYMENEFIPFCKEEYEIKSCKKCPQYTDIKDCWWLKEVKDLKERLANIKD